MFDADARKAELQAIYDEGDGGNWAPIKEIATGLGITKPEDGWEAAIALIVEAEATQANPPNDANSTTEIQKLVSQPPPEITPWRKPRTDLYGNRIPSPWQS
ncbi:MAG: hypothetical protein AAF151_11955 [Cyanobacteria bacterium J06656_5]